MTIRFDPRSSWDNADTRWDWRTRDPVGADADVNATLPLRPLIRLMGEPTRALRGVMAYWRA